MSISGLLKLSIGMVFFSPNLKYQNIRNIRVFCLFIKNKLFYILHFKNRKEKLRKLHFLFLQEPFKDPNTRDRVKEIYSKFQIIVVWDINFMWICSLSKILNNKDCDMGMKPSYRETLHMHVKYGTPITSYVQIWIRLFDTLRNTRY
jgi:hypothetical protein